MGNANGKNSVQSNDILRFSKPTGLYASCPWDLKTVRRLILERKIAPRIPGVDKEDAIYTEECPICFMYYPRNLNMAACCKKTLCSECFLQLKPPKKRVSCPFCNHDTFGIRFNPIHCIDIVAQKLQQQGSRADQTRKILHSKLSSARAESCLEQSLSGQVATVADRKRFHQDLRKQCDYVSVPVGGTARDSGVEASVYLEEYMLMEGIRRSLMTVESEDQLLVPRTSTRPGDSTSHTKADAASLSYEKGNARPNVYVEEA